MILEFIFYYITIISDVINLIFYNNYSNIIIGADFRIYILLYNYN